MWSSIIKQTLTRSYQSYAGFEYTVTRYRTFGKNQVSVTNKARLGEKIDNEHIQNKYSLFNPFFHTNTEHNIFCLDKKSTMIMMINHYK